MSKYNHTVEIDNFASRRSRVPERQKIVKLNCVARALQTYVIKDRRGEPTKLNQINQQKHGNFNFLETKLNYDLTEGSTVLT